MTTITGNATSAAGDPVEQVRVFGWPDGALVDAVVPDAQGDWSTTLTDEGNYGVTYLRSGHEPITHGPYYVEVSTLPASGRYFRINLEGAHDPAKEPMLTEVWLERNGQQILSKTEAVTSSGYYSSSYYYGPDNIIDGAVDTVTAAQDGALDNRYIADTLTGAWLQIDLGAIKEFDKVHLLGAGAEGYGTARCPINWSMEVSENGTDWTVLYSTTDEPVWTELEIRSYDALVTPTVWTPANLFSNNEVGAWHDPSDLSTLFQDASGTVPVTADGDPVGLMLDKSGHGLHAKQVTDTLRPVWRSGGYLEGDGVRYLTVPDSKAAFNYLHNGAFASVFTGLSVGNSSNPETLYGWLGNAAGTTSSTGITLFYDDRSQYSMYDRYRVGMSKGTSGTSVMGNYPVGTNYHITPQTNVLAEITYAVSLDPHCTMRVNGVTKDTPPFEVLPGTQDATYDMDVMAMGNGSFPLVGKFFGVCIINKVLSSEDLTKVRDFYYGKMGI